VGMGLVLNGQLFRGATGAAGEVGYLPLAADANDRSSRRRGALESALGAAGIVASARAAGMRPPLTAQRIFGEARRGDPAAVEIVGRVADQIAVALAAIVPVVDPELVILGGGVGRNGDLLLERVRHHLEAISPFRPRLEISVLGEEAELQGAVALALRTAQDQLFDRPQGRGRPAV
jgi:predicted NBD/HSP70 family sugar kinase